LLHKLEKGKILGPLPITAGEVPDAYNNFASFRGTGGDKCRVLPYQMLSSANLWLAELLYDRYLGCADAPDYWHNSDALLAEKAR